MKLGKTVLLEIVSIFQNALLKGEDASQALREIDISHEPDSDLSDSEVVELSDSYVKAHPRADEWKE